MRIFLSFLLILFAFQAQAEEATSTQPLEITADKALEWNQTDKTYTARGNALAKQGDLSVKADILTATYAGANGDNSDITLLHAEGNVILTSGDNIATGDKAVYDLIKGEATLSGKRPKVVQNGKNSLEADHITVWTKNNVLDHAEATGNVVITSGEQIGTGDKATYTAATTMASLIGNVKIKQGNSWLQGDQADMNMSTHVSKMTGRKGEGRVKGVFYPGSGKKN